MLIAPSAFKGSLTARAAARVMAGALADVAEVRLLPLADGGDGTAAVLARALGGAPLPLWVPDALGREHRALAWRLGGGAGAAVDLAAVCGLRRLLVRRATPRPETATTLGLGLALAALARQIAAGPIYVGLGGSASTDGGAGLLAGLGARLLDTDGLPIGPGGAGLARLARLDLSGVPPGLADRLVVLVDVTTRLLGPYGAAAAFGPQKGADAGAVARLDAALNRLADVAEADTGAAPALRLLPGSGAAGGTGYALALLGAALLPGAARVLDIVGFDDALAWADIVVAGEGGLDATSFAGKAPLEALGRARAAGRAGVLVCARAESGARRRLEAAGAVVAEAAPAGGRAAAADLACAARRAVGRLGGLSA